MKTVEKNEKTKRFTMESSHQVIEIKKSKREVRKIKKKYKESTIIINNKSRGVLLKEKELSVSDFSDEMLLPIIEKVCRETAKKYNISLPLEDLYLYSASETACKYIEKLIGISRIFTVVTDETLSEDADRLYFKYGCLIRHSRKVKNSNFKESMSIFIENSAPSHSIAVNLTGETIINENVINIREISVTDKTTEAIIKDIECSSGLALYKILGKVPGENAIINISQKADTIFLLDTK